MTIHKADLLTRNERALINEALDFHFTGSICLKNYENKLTIIIDPSKRSVLGSPIDIGDVEEALEEAKKEVIKATKQYEKLSEQFHDYWKRNRERQNNPDVIAETKKLHRLKNAAESELGCARYRVNAIQSILKESNGKEVRRERILLGEFDPAKEEVRIYLGSFNDDDEHRYYHLIPTFIHEMFHAINYFNSGGNRAIREVEEPMVEFATGVFLEAISNTNYDFKIVSNNHRMDVLRKTTDIGEIVCYGFGRYLMDNVSSESTHSEIEWIEAYALKASSLKPSSSDAQMVVKLLYPFYPVEDEQTVLKLFESIIFGSVSSSSKAIGIHRKRKTPAPATGIRITRKDGSILQMRTAGDTLVQAIIEAGPMNVYNLGIICCGFPLVANSISPKYGPTQVEVMPGIYVMKHSNTIMKKRFLDRISDALGLGWKVDIV